MGSTLADPTMPRKIPPAVERALRDVLAWRKTGRTRSMFTLRSGRARGDAGRVKAAGAESTCGVLPLNA